MKKILWLSHFLPYPPKGGMLQRSYNLLREVSKHHDVTLLAFNQSKLAPTELEISLGVNHLSQFCKFAGLVGIDAEKSKFNKLKLLCSGLLPWQTYTVNWLKSSEFQKVLRKVLEQNTFDIIHVDTISLIPYVINEKKYKIVLNHHNVESLMLLRRAENEKNIFKKAYFFFEGLKLKKYEHDVCSRVVLNLTCSALDSVRLKEISNDARCIDVPNGVDLSYFKPSGVLTKEKSIIFAGGFSWYPNVEAMTFFLKEVWPRLAKEIPDVKMTVVGRSPKEWMLELQKNYPNLTVTGFVDDVRPFIENAYLYVCPIRDGGGTKLKVLDALAMKKLLIAHPIACEGIDVVNRRDVVFAESADEYIDRIKEFFADPKQAAEIAESGYKLISEKYDFIKIGDLLSGAYEEICL